MPPAQRVFCNLYHSDCTKLIRETAGELGLSLAEYLGSIQEYPMPELAYKYQYGNPLVRPEEVPKLPKKMRRLHQWYIATNKNTKGTNWLILGIKDEFFLRGNEEIHIEFEELFQLFNQDAIDKSTFGAYCL